MDKILLVSNIDEKTKISETLRKKYNIVEVNNILNTLNELKKKIKYSLVIVFSDTINNFVENLCINLREKYSKFELPILIIVKSNNNSESFYQLLANDFFKLNSSTNDLFARIKNLISYKYFLDDVKKTRDKLNFLNKVSNILNSTLNIDEIIQKLLKLTVNITKAITGSIFILNSDGEIKKKILSFDSSKKNNEKIKIEHVMKEGLAGWVFKYKKIAIINDTNEDFRWIKINTPEQNRIRSVICVPILRHNILLGILTLHHYEVNHFNEKHRELLVQIANRASIALENANMFEKQKNYAEIDNLTELFNKRIFYNIAEKEYNKSVRFKVPLSVMMIDIDFFKRINDSHGHIIGDKVLKEFSKYLQSLIRSFDILARFGGEEFIILMPNTSTDGAMILAERIKNKIERKKLLIIKKEKINLKISIGIAQRNKSSTSIQSIIKDSDDALYKAKRNGRNRVEVFKA